MKHIKLFEDYSDEELRDLQDDLHGIGHKARFVQGEDFGFGDDFKEPNTGRRYISISEEMVIKLISIGEISKNNIILSFENPKDFGIPDGFSCEIKSGGFNSPYYIYIVQELSGSTKNMNNSDWISMFDNILKKLGEVRI